MDTRWITFCVITIQVLGVIVSKEWGPWSDSTPCSHTCGRGIIRQTRKCLREDNKCLGSTEQYRICNLKTCSPGLPDSRAHQCAKFNKKSTKDIHWTPAYEDGSEDCSLKCKSKESGDISQLRDHVDNGTSCGENQQSVCIHGKCLSVGCDAIVGSTSQLDKCQVCGGNNADCYRIERKYKLSNHINGYNDIFNIPVGSTSIKITNTNHGQNYIALRSNTGEYFLKGDFEARELQVLHATGTKFSYLLPESEHNETLFAPGPTNNTVSVIIFIQEHKPQQLVEFEYYEELSSALPGLKDAKPKKVGWVKKAELDKLSRPEDTLVSSDERWSHVVYKWVARDWLKCSASCGGGVKRREVQCISIATKKPVSHTYCNYGNKLATTVKCNTHACEIFSWDVGEWEACTATCGTGQQSRKVKCFQQTGARLTIPNDLCHTTLGYKPVETRPCPDLPSCERSHNTPHNQAILKALTDVRCMNGPCWITLDWSECSASCDKGTKRRVVVCVNGIDVSEPQTCDGLKKPTEVKVCFGHDCGDSVPCGQSKFGCCRDGLTPAMGVNKEGCDFALLGDETSVSKKLCNESEYGCCKDGITFAKGPDYEGCGKEAGCLASKYGCCPDRVSLATGPNLAGCVGISRCLLPPETGPCQASIHRWFFNAKAGKCGKFTYGGCAGNANRFVTRKLCMKHCAKFAQRRLGKEVDVGERTAAPTDTVSVTAAKISTSKDVCSMAKDQRRTCGKMVVRWYYNDKLEKCKRFWYSNCGDPGNHFTSRTACRRRCVSGAEDRVTPVTSERPRIIERHRVIGAAAVCSLPKHKLFCSKWQRRWYFKQDVAKCKAFWFGGCPEKGKNVFSSKAACEQICLAARRYDVKKYTIFTGPDPTVATGRVPSTDGRVVSDRKILVKSNQCLVVPARRRCGKWKVKWNYDKKRLACVRFWYGQCPGTKNVFDSRSDCQQACMNVGPQRYRHTNVVPAVTTPNDRSTATASPIQNETFAVDLTTDDDNKNSTTHLNLNVTSDVDMTDLTETYTTKTDPSAPSAEPTPTISQINTAVCYQPKNTRRCKEWVVRWYFHREKGCRQFWYGSCGDAGNVFRTRDDCRRTCGGRRVTRPVVHHRSTNTSVKPNVVDLTIERNLTQAPTAEPTPTNSSINSAVCYQPKNTRRCKEWVVRWYFHREKGCRQFWYGSCGDTGNVFRTRDDCRRTCGGRRVVQPVRPVAPYVRRPVSSLCYLAKDTRFCKKWSGRYFYNSTSRKCQFFWHGGCSNDGNLFGSKKLCEYKCGGRTHGILTKGKVVVREGTEGVTPGVVVMRNVCRMNKDTRRCGKKMLVRWFYDYTMKRCRRFWFGQCDAGGNMFKSQSDCSRKCVHHPVTKAPVTVPARRLHPCQQPVILRKLCVKWVAKWHYDSTRGICKQFWSGGCRHHGNEFASKDLCIRTCQRAAVTDTDDESRDKDDGESGEVPSEIIQESVTEGSGEVDQTTVALVKDCRSSRHGCCPDGVTAAKEPDFTHCPGIRDTQPSIKAFEKEQIVVKVGALVRIPCIVRGHPKPRVIWYKDRRPLVSGGRLRVDSNNTLVLTTTGTSDSGVYLCRAYNKKGVVSRELRLSVQGERARPDERRVAPTVSPSDIRASPGDTIYLNCVTPAARVTRVTWWHNRQHVLTQPRYTVNATGTLRIEAVRLSDAGVYTCRAQLGERVSSLTVKLVVGDKINVAITSTKHDFMRGGELMLQCRVSGTPPIRITWYHGDDRLVSTGRVSMNALGLLKIRKLTFKDAGMYTCTASNGQVSETASRIVRIKQRDLYGSGECKDINSYHSCMIVVNGNLCRHYMFAKSCCESCGKKLRRIT